MEVNMLDEVKRLEFTRGFKAGKVAIIKEIEDTYSNGDFRISLECINPQILDMLKEKHLDIPGIAKGFMRLGEGSLNYTREPKK